MNGFKGVESKYGVTVRSEGFHMNRSGKRVETFKLYSADGCLWQNGLSRKGVKAECEEWAKQLLSIKSNERGK